MLSLSFTTIAASLCMLATPTFALPGDATNNTSPPNLSDHPSHLGCFLNLPPPVSHTILTESHITITECASHCTGSAPYFGLSANHHCSCYASAPEHHVPDAEAQHCTSHPGHANIYVTPRPHPQHVVNNFHHQGCYTDSASHHSLTSKVVQSPSMTPTLCAKICAAYPLFGVEFGTQCFCGRRLSKSAHIRPEEECAMRCGGEKEYTCGGADRMDLYRSGVGEKTGWNYKRVGPFGYKGCWTDSVEVRTLGVDGGRDGGMTLEGCAGVCDGYQFFGVEFGTQCFCGDWLGGGRTKGRECSELCAGSEEQLCGGADRLSVYEKVEGGGGY